MVSCAGCSVTGCRTCCCCSLVELGEQIFGIHHVLDAVVARQDVRRHGHQIGVLVDLGRTESDRAAADDRSLDRGSLDHQEDEVVGGANVVAGVLQHALHPERLAGSCGERGRDLRALEVGRDVAHRHRVVGAADVVDLAIFCHRFARVGDEADEVLTGRDGGGEGDRLVDRSVSPGWRSSGPTSSSTGSLIVISSFSER